MSSGKTRAEPLNAILIGNHVLVGSQQASSSAIPQQPKQPGTQVVPHPSKQPGTRPMLLR